MISISYAAILVVIILIDIFIIWMTKTYYESKLIEATAQYIDSLRGCDRRREFVQSSLEQSERRLKVANEIINHMNLEKDNLK